MQNIITERVVSHTTVLLFQSRRPYLGLQTFKLDNCFNNIIKYHLVHSSKCVSVQPVLDHLQSEYVLNFSMGLNDNFI
ncbi:hypothetical protein CR513_26791, partial [Mucuna pruriens]